MPPKLYGKRESIDNNIVLPPRGSNTSRSASVTSFRNPAAKLPAIPQLPATPSSFKRYCHFAFASYSKSLYSTKTLPARDPFTATEIVKTCVDVPTTNYGFISLSFDTNEIICSFRGSKHWKQIFNGMDIDTVPFVCDGSVRVHEKFQIAYMTMRALILDMNEVARKYHEFKIVFTGHSLGGAIASMAAVEYHLRYPEDTGRLLMVNFGSPRVGLDSWAKFVNGMRFSKHRVVNVGDPISHFPLNSFGYHHHRELWMLEGEGEELQNMPDSDDLNVLDTSIEKHLIYFGIEIVD